MKKLLALAIALIATLSSAFAAQAEPLAPAQALPAENIILYGTVVCAQSLPVVCAVQGTIDTVRFAVGDRVAAGDILATALTQKVYAQADGTVYLFGEPGDRLDDIARQYGAAAYIAPAQPYTVTATAVNQNDVAVSVIPGEVVYLRCYKDGLHTGQGIVARPDKGKYTVVVTQGAFIAGETVTVYRSADYAGASRIGRARVDAAEMLTCGGEGHLVKFHVSSGDKVKKGALLYETAGGSFAAGGDSPHHILAPVAGILSALYIQPGSALTGGAAAASADDKQAEPGAATASADDKQAEPGAAAITPASPHVIAQIYPDAFLRVVAYAPESALNALHVNDTVYVGWQYIENMAEPVRGTVEKIARVPTPDAQSVEALYAVSITVDDPDPFYYGMNVVVATLGGV